MPESRPSQRLKTLGGGGGGAPSRLAWVHSPGLDLSAGGLLRVVH